MKHKRNFTVTAVTLSLVVSAFVWAKTNRTNTKSSHSIRSAIAQDVEREILQERPNPKDPVELTEIIVQGKTVRLKEKFSGDNEWINKTSLKLKNKHTKTIVFIQVNVDFPETATSGIMLQEQFHLGRHPVYGKMTDPQTLNLKTGETIEVSLSKEFDRIKRMVERRHAPIGFINKILIRLSDIGFDDGTVYAAGAFFKKNPDVNFPQKWIQIQE